MSEKQPLVEHLAMNEYEIGRTKHLLVEREIEGYQSAFKYILSGILLVEIAEWDKNRANYTKTTMIHGAPQSLAQIVSPEIRMNLFNPGDSSRFVFKGRVVTTGGKICDRVTSLRPQRGFKWIVKKECQIDMNTVISVMWTPYFLDSQFSTRHFQLHMGDSEYSVSNYTTNMIYQAKRVKRSEYRQEFTMSSIHTEQDATRGLVTMTPATDRVEVLYPITTYDFEKLAPKYIEKLTTYSKILLALLWIWVTRNLIVGSVFACNKFVLAWIEMISQKGHPYVILQELDPRADEGIDGCCVFPLYMMRILYHGVIGKPRWAARV